MYKTSRLVRISILISAITKSFAFFSLIYKTELSPLDMIFFFTTRSIHKIPIPVRSTMNYVPVAMECYSKREEARNCNKRGKVMNMLPQQVSDTNALYSIEISAILKLRVILGRVAANCTMGPF